MKPIKVEGQNRASLSISEKRAVDEQIYDIIISGVPVTTRNQKILNMNIPGVKTQDDVNNYVTKILKKVSVSDERSMAYTINLHSQRYDKMYADESRLLDEKSFRELEPSQAAKMLTNALNAMIAKDNLYTIGRTDKDNIDRITQAIIAARTSDQKIDVEISEEDALKLHLIFQKARVREVGGVNPVKVEPGVKGEDIEEQIIDQDASNKKVSIPTNNYESVRAKVKEKEVEAKTMTEQVQEERIKTLANFFKQNGS